ncbi:M15 family metallopeptidase [Streptomyces sp. NPDC086023]|uniref:M15 family metallopeptidase n=1 Tax=Streptomyces sp. NPDC086023 TaxID=3365746 RepID=UPI0037CD264A
MNPAEPIRDFRIQCGSLIPGRFVNLAEVNSDIQIDIRYAGFSNFVGSPLDGYASPLCIVTWETADALAEAQRDLSARGYGLRVYDAYRPARAVAHIARWAADLDDQQTKKEFYPDVDKSRLFTDGYIHERSGHSRGSTVDVTLVSASGDPVDMGTGFDCFDPRSHTLYPRIGIEQRDNRLVLKGAMERAGFVNLAEEWWHYTFRPEPFPDTYFDFPVSPVSLGVASSP